MKKIITSKGNRRLRKKRKFSDFIFRHTVLKRVRKTIAKTYYAECFRTNTEIKSLFMVPSEFVKYSNQQIEKAFELLVKHEAIASWEHKTVKNADGYLIVFPVENGSQSRILSHIPEEINLSGEKVEPITKPF